MLETSAATLFKEGEPALIVASALGAVSLALATMIAKTSLSPEAIRRWTKLRAVSEAVKGEVYRCRAGSGPYRGADWAKELKGRIDTLLQVEQPVLALLVGVEAATTPMPSKLSPEDYIEQRVIDQRDRYFRPKAQAAARKADQLHLLILVLGGISALLGAATSAFAYLKIDALAVGAWVAVLTTLGGTLTSYLAASRLDYIATSYTDFAEQLSRLKQGWDVAGDKSATAWSRFVDDVEQLLATENQSWLAKHLEAS